MKALFINGSPRKNGNTAQLLKRAMDGAREAGAEVELVNLYDRNLNYKGYSRRLWRPTYWCAVRPTIVATPQPPFVPLWNEWSFLQSTILTTPNPSC